MEELKATQEESMRREEEFRGIVDALNQSVYIIEYELDGSIISVNSKFLHFLNKKEDEIIGKSHAYIFGAKTSVDSKFWDQLGQHPMITINEKLILGKKTYLIKEHFVTVTNKDGLPLKVLNFLTEIPDQATNY
jgi:methyl-accepting chemotaxis protein